VGNRRRRFGVGEGSSGKATGEKGAWSTFIAPHGRRKEEEGRGKITQPDTERRAAPACLTGRRGGRLGLLPDVEEQGGGQREHCGRWEEEQHDTWSGA
jgi:hypothetical protein